jgi:hypothetical protein
MGQLQPLSQFHSSAFRLLPVLLSQRPQKSIYALVFSSGGLFLGSTNRPPSSRRLRFPLQGELFLAARERGIARAKVTQIV